VSTTQALSFYIRGQVFEADLMISRETQSFVGELPIKVIEPQDFLLTLAN